jgi:hypothetical protein
MAVTTVLAFNGTNVRLSAGAPKGAASVDFGSEINVTPNANSATKGKNFKYRVAFTSYLRERVSPP